MFRRRREILEETIVTIVQALRFSSSAGRVFRHFATVSLMFSGDFGFASPYDGFYQLIERIRRRRESRRVFEF